MRGSAKNYICVSCGDPATVWAFQHQDENTWYSDDVDDYAAMCDSCHRKLDWSLRPAEDRKNRMNRAREVLRETCEVYPGARLRTYVQCGLTTTAMAMGNHFKASGHNEYRKVD